MTSRRPARHVTLAVVLAMAMAPLLALTGAGVAGAADFVTGTPSLATITDGSSAAPWNEAQGDPGTSSYPGSDLLPTFLPGGPTAGTPAEPNVGVVPGATSGTDGNTPYPSGVVGTPGPLAGYCGTGNQPAESTGTPARQPTGTTLPLAPAYFPHVVRNADGSLTGYFDYRPKDADEAIVVGRSTDNGQDWTYEGEALEQNTGYCPSADVNDDGQGHPNVLTVGGVTRLYTLQRAAGDDPGVGMVVHTLTAPDSSDPLAGVPTSEKVGIDPDAFATAGVSVPVSGGVSVPVNQTGVAGSTDQLVAGGFVDLTQDPNPTPSTILNCGVGAGVLTSCTTTQPGGLSVAGGDLIEQVIGYVSSTTVSAPVPAGPNTSGGDGGLAAINVAPSAAAAGGTTVGFTNPVTGTTYNNDAPNRAYVDGVAVYCVQANANPTTAMENCTTGPGASPLTLAAGQPITSDPVTPASAGQTSGLVAPDGIVGVLPTYPNDGSVPAGATYVMYTEKELGYYVAGTSTNTGAVKFSTGTITFSPSPYEAADMPAAASISASTPVTVSVGDITSASIVAVTCTGLTTGTTDTLSGCTSSAGVNDQFNKNSLIGAPGATTVANSTLGLTGEGAGAGPSAKNIAKLMKNNEDLTVLRVAYTTDGVNFSSVGLAHGGVISGTNSGGASYNDISSPASTTSPSNLNAYATPGTADATEMRWVGSSGTILTDSSSGTPTYQLFLSGSWPADGDSDAFNQIFEATSTDGEHWTVPSSVVSTDYTFSASAAQDADPSQRLGISAYYSGRAYGPSVVPNGDGSLTMVFAGYRIPKTISSAGTVLGTNPSALYTVGASDPALYRNILTVTLDPPPNGGDAPEAPVAVLLPLAGLAVGGVAVFLRRRRGTAV